jgi:splicing factor U2AF subunit
MGTDSYGKACVQFLEVEGARKAKEAIHGRLFAGQTVSVEHMQPQDFMALYQT